jgi:hypothetical protein
VARRWHAETHRCAGCGARAWQQFVEHAFLGRIHRAWTHFFHFLLACHFHRNVDEVLDDRIDFAAHVADFGELGRLDFDERRAARGRARRRGDLGFADNQGRADQSGCSSGVISARQALGDMHAPPAIAQSDATARFAALCRTMCLSSSWDDFSWGHGHGATSAPRS